jgi:outer membrane protein assembly factor BamD
MIIVSFDNFKKNFPDSKFMEELTFLKIEAQYKLAQQSISSKQKERFSATVEYYKELVDNYPKSEFLKEAERYYTGSLDQLNKLKNNKS